MIRESIARQRGAPASRSRGDSENTYTAHASFARLPLLPSGDEDGMCLIEPAVRCNHCGYCLSYGH
ncbi:MAG TPA: hypothetical protein VKE51_27265 [Vicinamibacterales bacterium]|nr:hypothetical protein [Vicinamibacterales bacterium]